MICPKCNKYLEGYRCPDFNIFLLDDPSLKRKKGSLYYKELSKDNHKMIPMYIFLFVFVAAWIIVVAYFLSQA